MTLVFNAVSVRETVDFLVRTRLLAACQVPAVSLGVRNMGLLDLGLWPLL